MKKKSLIEDKRNNKLQRPHTRWNPKRHILLVSAVKLWLYDALFGVQACESGSKAVRQNFEFLLRSLKKFHIQLYENVFMLQTQISMQDGVILFSKGGFCHIKCL